MELQGKDLLIQVSTVTANPTDADFKDLVCREDLTVDFSATVNKRKTVCGTKVGVSDPEVSITGSGVAEDTPTAAQVSHKDLLGISVNTTPVMVRVQHKDDPTKLFIQSQGYFTSLSISAPADDVVDFSFTIDASGTIDLAPNP